MTCMQPSAQNIYRSSDSLWVFQRLLEPIRLTYYTFPLRLFRLLYIFTFLFFSLWQTIENIQFWLCSALWRPSILSSLYWANWWGGVQLFVQWMICPPGLPVWGMETGGHKQPWLGPMPSIAYQPICSSSSLQQQPIKTSLQEIIWGYDLQACLGPLGWTINLELCWRGMMKQLEQRIM